MADSKVVSLDTKQSSAGVEQITRDTAQLHIGEKGHRFFVLYSVIAGEPVFLKVEETYATVVELLFAKIKQGKLIPPFTGTSTYGNESDRQEVHCRFTKWIDALTAEQKTALTSCPLPACPRDRTDIQIEFDELCDTYHVGIKSILVPIKSS